MYDERPLYEQRKDSTKVVDLLPRQIKPWSGFSLSDSRGSPLLNWALHNDAKRRRGELNEWDINEIKAALRGVKNKWRKLCETQEKKLCEFVNKPNQELYNEILTLLKLE